MHHSEDIYKERDVAYAGCIHCFDCIQACPEKRIALRWGLWSGRYSGQDSDEEGLPEGLLNLPLMPNKRVREDWDISLKGSSDIHEGLSDGIIGEIQVLIQIKKKNTLTL